MEARSLLLAAPYQFIWRTETLAQPEADQILVSSRTGAISMGTELALYRNTTAHTHPLRYPLMPGYETVGEVLACGPQVSHLAIGDRVVATYGHRTYACIPEHRAIRIPADISDALALLVILGCETAKGVAKVVAQQHEVVLITGGGTIGLLTLFNLRAHGTIQVDVVEPASPRHHLAIQLGAQQVWRPAELTDQLSAIYHVGFECSSTNDGFALLQRLLAPNGRLCVLADARREPLVLTPAFHEKELQIVGTSDGVDYPRYAAWYWPHARDNRWQLEQLFTRSVAFTDLPEAFAQMVNESVQPLKVLVQYSHNDN
jgi:alcohol dehydrogenase